MKNDTKSREYYIALSKYILNNSNIDTSVEREECYKQMKYMAIDFPDSKTPQLCAYPLHPIFDESQQEWIPSTEKPWYMFVDYFPSYMSTSHQNFQFPEKLIMCKPNYQLDTKPDDNHLDLRKLGYESTRRLYSHAYDLYCNKYNEKEIASNIKSLFNIDIDELDIHHIIGSVKFESAIASRTLLS